jgi:hypothetical protein
MKMWDREGRKKKHTFTNKILWELISYYPWFDTDRIENYERSNSYIACVLVAAVTYLAAVQHRYGVYTEGNTYRRTKAQSEDLPLNKIGQIVCVL